MRSSIVLISLVALVSTVTAASIDNFLDDVKEHLPFLERRDIDVNADVPCNSTSIPVPLETGGLEEAGDIKAGHLETRDINAGNIKTGDLKTGDISPVNLEANVLENDKLVSANL
ncbi:hypothetical protein BJ684DRAFT_18425 [Piptocephalis cylindrospora]|uniref:Uncharacterized protein n=1 Tax=Piptocephalis cylindrospora TaxID=1907219 RepID=A0A4P9Y883_9FUNG|nr:hypothetical protein BJ684DRAFT_18425 [Piptocephalis cylindrospora]|eukprot:RKP15235.1 hypothetical protein BJ684DRAFT_18425 [Piptocephalis cylindrospora]